MLECLYRGVTPWAKANKYQIMLNRILGRIANYSYPLYCKHRHISHNRPLAKDLCNKAVVISLTSFPARIEKVHLCINSLLRQTVSADRIILWLAESQFPQGKGVPQNLLELVKEGLEIRYCDDLRSYKKVFYTAQEHQDDIVVTVDDDTLYPEYWLSELIRTYQRYPNCVCCFRAHKMVLKNGKVAPYSEWIGLSPDEKGPDSLLVPIGVGGVLYPPGYFSNVEFDYAIISKLCPTADDLWLKTIGLHNQYTAVKVSPNSKEWFTILSTQRNSLMSTNVGENVNDTSMENLVNYYQIRFGEDSVK